MQDQAGEADEQEREVAEPQQPGLAARQEERGRAREQRAEDDGRADEVQQQREALVVGPDRGEQRQAPGFQIMSITISTIAADARARSRSPVGVRFKAVSSALGPVWPEATSALAFSTGFAYSAKERTQRRPQR